MGQVSAVDMTMTKVTAMLMPRAELVFLETPMKGQMPMNLDSTKLSTSTALKRMMRYSFIYFSSPSPAQQPPEQP